MMNNLNSILLEGKFVDEKILLSNEKENKPYITITLLNLQPVMKGKK